MVASLLERNPIDEQLRSLTTIVEQLQQDVGELRRENSELRRENAELRRQVSELRCDVGYWRSRHADALRRNAVLQGELDQATAEIRQLKAERFGKQSEKQSSTDRSNDLADPQAQTTAKKKRGQQPDRPAPR
jgi:predicted RNase H-like nuclease (RuvC/YqgF family)